MQRRRLIILFAVMMVMFGTLARAATIVDYPKYSPQQRVTVAKSGGNYTTIQGAINAITDAATGKRYLVDVYPGTYVGDVTTTAYIYVAGHDPNTVIIDGDLVIAANSAVSLVSVASPHTTTGTIGTMTAGTGITSLGTSTPTTITGLIKGNGSVLSAASSAVGGDYIAPIARVIRVAKSGGDYTTIQAGVTAAAALSPAPSSTNPVQITISPGLYAEDVIIPVTLTYCTIAGSGSHSTILTGGVWNTRGMASLTFASNAGAARNAHITVRGIRFQQLFPGSILVRLSQNARTTNYVVFENCNFFWTAGSAIYGVAHEAYFANCGFDVNATAVPAFAFLQSSGEAAWTSGDGAVPHAAMTCDTSTAAYKYESCATFAKGAVLASEDEILAHCHPTQVPSTGLNPYMTSLRFLAKASAPIASTDLRLQLIDASNNILSDALNVPAITTSWQYLEIPVTNTSGTVDGLLNSAVVDHVNLVVRTDIGAEVTWTLSINDMVLQRVSKQHTQRIDNFADNDAYIYDSHTGDMLALVSGQADHLAAVEASSPLTFIGNDIRIRDYSNYSISRTLGFIRAHTASASQRLLFVGNRAHITVGPTTTAELFRVEGGVSLLVAGNAINVNGIGATTEEVWVAQAFGTGQLAINGNAITQNANVDVAKWHFARGNVVSQDAWTEKTADLTNYWPAVTLNKGSVVIDREAAKMKISNGTAWETVTSAAP